jgi:hypothetical protein
MADIRGAMHCSGGERWPPRPDLASKDSQGQINSHSLHRLSGQSTPARSVAKPVFGRRSASSVFHLSLHNFSTAGLHNFILAAPDRFMYPIVPIEGSRL